MGIMSAFEAKTRSGEMLGGVAGGEEIAITPHEKTVGRIVPVDRSHGKRCGGRWSGRGLCGSGTASVSGSAVLTAAEVHSALEDGRQSWTGSYSTLPTPAGRGATCRSGENADPRPATGGCLPPHLIQPARRPRPPW
jgi:antitoxin (DNA-binding transcriptional repressor) of toxin-antitoxin stability system